jgi:hypothetical protein
MFVNSSRNEGSKSSTISSKSKITNSPWRRLKRKSAEEEEEEEEAWCWKWR